MGKCWRSTVCKQVKLECDQICENGSSYTYIQFCNSEEIQLLWLSYYAKTFSHVAKCNDSKVLLPNFKTGDQTQAELHSFKVEKLDACIPFHKSSHRLYA